VDASRFMVRALLQGFFARPDLDEVMVLAQHVAEGVAAIDRRVRSFASPLREVADRGRIGRHLPPFGPGAHQVVTRRALTRLATGALLRAPPSRAGPEPVGLIRDLLSEAGGEPGGGSGLLESTLATLIFAGYENTAAAASWLLWLLATHPDAQAEVREEGSRLGVDQFDLSRNMSFLRACIDETLRLYPPVWSTAREVISPLSLGDRALPAGALLVISPWLQHHRPESWLEHDAFQPERFRIPRQFSGDWLPFGLGPRACIGRALAFVELAAFVSAVLQKWELRSPPEHRPPQPRFVTNLRPGEDLVVHLRSL